MLSTVGRLLCSKACGIIFKPQTIQPRNIQLFKRNFKLNVYSQFHTSSSTKSFSLVRNFHFIRKKNNKSFQFDEPKPSQQDLSTKNLLEGFSVGAPETNTKSFSAAEHLMNQDYEAWAKYIGNIYHPKEKMEVAEDSIIALAQSNHFFGRIISPPAADHAYQGDLRLFKDIIMALKKPVAASTIALSPKVTLIIFNLTLRMLGRAMFSGVKEGLKHYLILCKIFGEDPSHSESISQRVRLISNTSARASSEYPLESSQLETTVGSLWTVVQNIQYQELPSGFLPVLMDSFLHSKFVAPSAVMFAKLINMCEPSRSFFLALNAGASIISKTHPDLVLHALSKFVISTSENPSAPTSLHIHPKAITCYSAVYLSLPLLYFGTPSLDYLQHIFKTRHKCSVFYDNLDGFFTALRTLPPQVSTYYHAYKDAILANRLPMVTPQFVESVAFLASTFATRSAFKLVKLEENRGYLSPNSSLMSQALHPLITIAAAIDDIQTLSAALDMSFPLPTDPATRSTSAKPEDVSPYWNNYTAKIVLRAYCRTKDMEGLLKALKIIAHHSTDENVRISSFIYPFFKHFLVFDTRVSKLVHEICSKRTTHKLTSTFYGMLMDGVTRGPNALQDRRDFLQIMIDNQIFFGTFPCVLMLEAAVRANQDITVAGIYKLFNEFGSKQRRKLSQHYASHCWSKIHLDQGELLDRSKQLRLFPSIDLAEYRKLDAALAYLKDEDHPQYTHLFTLLAPVNRMTPVKWRTIMYQAATFKRYGVLKHLWKLEETRPTRLPFHAQQWFTRHLISEAPIDFVISRWFSAFPVSVQLTHIMYAYQFVIPRHALRFYSFLVEFNQKHPSFIPFTVFERIYKKIQTTEHQDIVNEIARYGLMRPGIYGFEEVTSFSKAIETRYEKHYTFDDYVSADGNVIASKWLGSYKELIKAAHGWNLKLELSSSQQNQPLPWPPADSIVPYQNINEWGYLLNVDMERMWEPFQFEQEEKKVEL